MMFKTLLKICILIICFVHAFNVKAEPKPRWVKKGVTELNKKRTNDSYSFHIFHQEKFDNPRFDIDPFQPLLDYVDNTYGVESSQLSVDSIAPNGNLPATYFINFYKDGRENTVYARRIDTYTKIEDYADNSYDYNFYQLYAISQPGVTDPDFDQFILKRKYGPLPVMMSIIPGLGQIYKGETAKGYTFMGVEAAMIASIIYSSTQVHKWMNLGKQHPEFYESYKSKALSFRQWRTFCYIAGGGLYLYNLLDAAFAKGARYVEIKRPNAPNMQLSLAPAINPDMIGLGININL